MLKQHHAQRQHIIISLDALCYQLHTLSFILSPSIWSFLCRLASQFQCSPRNLDQTASRSLRFFFANILLLNLSSVWKHATYGAAEGRAIVLDFAGMGYVPSRLQLLGLDFLIIFLQLVLATIVYETSLLQPSNGSDTPDMSLPIPNSLLSPEPSPLFTSLPSTTPAMSQHKKSYPPNSTSSYVVDLQLRHIIERLRNPPPPQASNSDASLPLPNTTPWPLPTGMRMLLRASARMRRETGDATPTRIPGSLSTRDG